MEEVRPKLKRFITENFLFGNPDAVLEDDTSFLETRIIDSTGILELVAFLEETWGIEVLDEEIDPENLDSISRLAAFVERKRSH